MAHWELNPAFSNVRKKVGNMVFYKVNGRLYSRKAPGKRANTTPAQELVKQSFIAVSSCWKNLDGIVQQSWRSWAKERTYITGRAGFLGANISRHKNGEPLELSKNLGENGFVSFTAKSGTMQGEIICEFTLNRSDSSKHVTVFRQKIINGLGSDQITRIEIPADTASPFIVTGCEPGCGYFIYGVITDKEYKDARSISSAESVICSAM